MIKNIHPLHGITLERLLKELVNQYGREGLFHQLNIKCFGNNPSIKSCLKFLRNKEFERARKKVENLYIHTNKKSSGFYE